MRTKTRRVGPNWHQVNSKNWVFTYDLERLKAGHPELLIGAVFESRGSYGVYGFPGSEDLGFESLKEAKEFVENQTIWYPELQEENLSLSDFKSRLEQR